MTDIFDATILCRKDNVRMRPVIINRNGLELRAVECPKCHDKIIHPADLNAQENFKDLRDKKFNVKLRMVGNSHAISIPKEIIDFMNERHRDVHREMRSDMDDMVRLWFDDFDTLKLSFFDDENEDDMNQDADMGDEVKESDDGRVRKRVRSDGKGNIDIMEEQNLNDPMRGIHGVRRVRKIRRIYNDKE